MGGGKSGGGGNTTSTNYTSNLPEYAKPYYERLMSQAESASQQPYIPYNQPRLTGFNPDQQAVFQGARDIASAGAPQDIINASGFAQTAGQYTPNYTPTNFNSGMFDQSAAQQYMSPYMQSVLDVQTGRMQRAFNEQQAGRDANAVFSGAYGGNRAGIENEVARRGLNEQMQAVEAQGLQSAYENAQQMFDKDRNANLAAQQLSDQSRQFGANIGLAGAQNQLGAASTLGGLGQLQQQMAIERLSPLASTGAQQQQLAQQSLDVGYQDFLRQQGYTQDQINYLSSILHGVPVQASGTSTTSQGSPSITQTLAGLGLAGFGLSRLV